jgi:hypothetical protein
MRKPYHRFPYFVILLGLFLALTVLQWSQEVKAQEGYPGQPLPTPTLIQPYPAQPVDQTQATAAPESPPPIIGADSPFNDAASGGTEVNAQPVNQQTNLGRYYLWGGFVAALLILATSIYGSITLFIRRKV